MWIYYISCFASISKYLHQDYELYIVTPDKDSKGHGDADFVS